MPKDPSTDAPSGSDAALDFEKAVEQIEQIIERIESGQIGLERSLGEYERGAALIRRCREALGKAEQRVEELTARMQSDAKVKRAAAAESAPPGPDGETPF
jgi:exodeoxyribonuclease VII small subunit